MYLIDTHILLWWLSAPEMLTKKEYSIIEDKNNEVFISVASIWEIAIKTAAKKLSVSNNFEKEIETEGFILLPIDFTTAWQVKDLPLYHADPFDRLLAATAQVNNLTLLTHDKIFKKYGVNLL